MNYSRNCNKSNRPTIKWNLTIVVKSVSTEEPGAQISLILMVTVIVTRRNFCLLIHLRVHIHCRVLRSSSEPGAVVLKTKVFQEDTIKRCAQNFILPISVCQERNKGRLSKGVRLPVIQETISAAFSGNSFTFEKVNWRAWRHSLSTEKRTIPLSLQKSATSFFLNSDSLRKISK